MSDVWHVPSDDDPTEIVEIRPVTITPPLSALQEPPQDHLTGNETQPCKNCGKPISFHVHRGEWLHVGGWDFKQCAVYATPTTPIEGIDY